MGKQARAERRRAQADHLEHAMRAHDRIHADDIEGAHDALHALLGVGRVEYEGPPLAPGLGFDHAFRDLCVRFGVRAAYVAVEGIEGEAQRGRLSAGGDSAVCAVVRSALEETR